MRRKVHNAVGAEEELEVVPPGFRPVEIRSDDGERTLDGARERRGEEGARASRDTAHRDGARFGKLFDPSAERFEAGVALGSAKELLRERVGGLYHGATTRALPTASSAARQSAPRTRNGSQSSRPSRVSRRCVLSDPAVRSARGGSADPV